MKTTKQDFRDVPHRERRKMSRRAQRRWDRQAHESQMAGAYRRLCEMEAGR